MLSSTSDTILIVSSCMHSKRDKQALRSTSLKRSQYQDYNTLHEDFRKSQFPWSFPYEAASGLELHFILGKTLPDLSLSSLISAVCSWLLELMSQSSSNPDIFLLAQSLVSRGDRKLAVLQLWSVSAAPTSELSTFPISFDWFSVSRATRKSNIQKNIS